MTQMGELTHYCIIYATDSRNVILVVYLRSKASGESFASGMAITLA